MDQLPPFYLYLFMGLFFALWSLGALLRFAVVLSWPRVSGRVVSVHRRWRSVLAEGLDPRDLVVVYEYSVGGRTYAREVAVARPRSAETVYEPGSPVIVYYHPRNPGRSHLGQAFDTSNYVWFALGVVMLLLVAGVVLGGP